MASTATLSDLRARALDYADMTGSNFPVEARVDDYINSAASEMYDILVNAYEDYFLATQSITLVPGTEDYALPSDFYKAKRVYYTTGSRRFSIHPFNLEEVDGARNSALSAGTAELWYVPEMSLMKPSTVITGATQANPCVITSANHGLDTGDSVTISGVVGMTELNGGVYTITKVSDNTFSLNDVDSSAFTSYASAGTVESTIATTIPPMIKGWPDYIALSAAIRLLIREESDPSALMAEKQIMQNRLISLAEPRDAGIPDSIQDVGHRWNSVGFAYDPGAFLMRYRIMGQNIKFIQYDAGV